MGVRLRRPRDRPAHRRRRRQAPRRRRRGDRLLGGAVGAAARRRHRGLPAARRTRAESARHRAPHPAHPARERGEPAGGARRPGSPGKGVERAGGGRRDGSRHDLIVWSRLRTDSGEPTPRLLPDLPGGELTDGVVTLRPLLAADAEDTFALRSLPDVVATSVPPVRQGVRHHRRDLCPGPVRLARRSARRLHHPGRGDGAYAGEIGLYYWDPATQQAMTGYSLMPEWRGRGYTTRAVRLVAAWAFSIGIARLIAGTAPENVDSQRVLRAGRLRAGGLPPRRGCPGRTAPASTTFNGYCCQTWNGPPVQTGGPDRSARLR